MPSTPAKKIIEEITSRYYPLNKKDFFFVQIGANDGISTDPIFEYILKFAWKGILIEPVPYLFKQLLNTYKRVEGLIFENIAIDHTDGIRPFYTLRYSDKDDTPAWYGLIGSLKKEVLLRYQNTVPDFDKHFQVQNITCMSLETLFSKYKITSLDLLCIDAEGYDFEIIKLIPFSRVKPNMLFFEHQFLNESELLECKSLLKAQGYEMVWFDIDAFAYLQNH